MVLFLDSMGAHANDVSMHERNLRRSGLSMVLQLEPRYMHDPEHLVLLFNKRCRSNKRLRSCWTLVLSSLFNT